MRIPDNSFSRTDFSGVGRNEGTQLPEGTQHNPPPAKTSLCPLSVQVGMELAFLVARVHKRKPDIPSSAFQPDRPTLPTCAAVAESVYLTASDEYLLLSYPIKVQDCTLLPQPPRSVEDREYMTHCGPQEPVGIEGNSACALKLSRRGVSDVEKFIQGKLEAAAPATLREDKSWLWILSAYGLSKPPASHVVEQLLRKVSGRRSWLPAGGVLAGKVQH